MPCWILLVIVMGRRLKLKVALGPDFSNQV